MTREDDTEVATQTGFGLANASSLVSFMLQLYHTCEQNPLLGGQESVPQHLQGEAIRISLPMSLGGASLRPVITGGPAHTGVGGTQSNALLCCVDGNTANMATEASKPSELWCLKRKQVDPQLPSGPKMSC